MRVVVAVGHVQRRGADRGGLAVAEQAQLDVDARGRGLDQAQRADELARHRLARDREIIDGALGLRAPQRIGGHLQLAHAVALNPETLVP